MDPKIGGNVLELSTSAVSSNIGLRHVIFGRPIYLRSVFITRNKCVTALEGTLSRDWPFNRIFKICYILLRWAPFYRIPLKIISMHRFSPNGFPLNRLPPEGHNGYPLNRFPLNRFPLNRFPFNRILRNCLFLTQIIN
jgi:hypothetical protein